MRMSTIDSANFGEGLPRGPMAEDPEAWKEFEETQRIDGEERTDHLRRFCICLTVGWKLISYIRSKQLTALTALPKKEEE